MEVTRRNFKETLPLIEQSIKAADFLVIDCEFTGLLNGRDALIFDSPQEYYQRLLNGSSEFMLIQYGLCAFYWDEKENHYMNDAYNFYLFPRGKPGPDRMFMSQSSSLDFLAAQGFDFNKLIREGISYMTESTESRMREHLTERQRLYTNENDCRITIPEENKQQVLDICKRVRHFLDEKNSDEMEIDRCNAFIRRLLYQELRARFKNEAYVESKVLENKNRVLKVTRIKSVNDETDKDLLKKQKEWEDLEDAVGFSKVARMISQCEKLVVGHNMVLDLLHTLNHFFQPLSPDYDNFKEFAHCMFPRILDTKYMASLPPFKDKVTSTVLPHLLSTLSEAPFSIPKTESLKGLGYSQLDDKQHEAGYDAFVTGLCFLAMHSHLAEMRGETDLRERVKGADAAILKPFLNKLYLSRTAHYDSPYISLVGKEPSPPRDHVFHLTFPKEWQRNDISQLFSAFGPVTVQFIDDTSALIGLSRREQARDVMRSLTGNTRYSLQPYAKYKLNLSIAKARDPRWRRLDCPTVRSAPNLTTRLRYGGNVSDSTDIIPLKMERKRSNSASPASPPTSPSPTNRKRTSSGVFEIDESEPPAKKAEVTPPEDTRTYSQVTQTPVNGRQNNAEKSEEMSKRMDTPVPMKKKVIERFEKSKDVNKCVTAFKEDDSWE